jgi:hypothetical protein
MAAALEVFFRGYAQRALRDTVRLLVDIGGAQWARAELTARVAHLDNENPTRAGKRDAGMTAALLASNASGGARRRHQPVTSDRRHSGHG